MRLGATAYPLSSALNASVKNPLFIPFYNLVQKQLLKLMADVDLFRAILRRKFMWDPPIELMHYYEWTNALFLLPKDNNEPVNGSFRVGFRFLQLIR